MANFIKMEENRWWKNVTDSYIVRELSMPDMEQIEELIHIKQNFWKTANLTECEIKRYVNLYAEKFKDPTKWKCMGAFLDNKLIMETSAFYPTNFNCWYSTSLRHHTSNISLGTGNLQRYLFADCFLPLIQHGENLKKFSFYAMRSVHHQRIINKMWNRAKSNSPLSRYEYYIDGYVLANNQNSNSAYQIFFPDKKTYDIDLVVYLHCLKHSIRLDILKEKFNFQD